MKPKSSINQY
uniref:Uncharacterized protein n=1 Tax=Anguilla anguilla TaxID=7936 RepID=A0A0E9VIH5_ANGAN